MIALQEMEQAKQVEGALADKLSQPEDMKGLAFAAERVAEKSESYLQAVQAELRTWTNLARR